MKKTVFAVMALVACAAARGDVELGAPFADGMVLQRDRPVPVWGKAGPGEKVTVTFAGASKSAVAGKDGAWRVDLDPMPASKESRVLVAKGSSVREVKDVLVGEVWFASGQSNMECPIWGWDPRYRDGKGMMMVNSTRRPYIRWAKNPRKWAAKPQPISGVQWRPFTPEAFAALRGEYPSAVAFYYALEIYGALEVPVGIIDSSWGGTNIDAWTPRSGWADHPELKDVASFPVTDKWDDSMRRGVISGPNQQPSALWNGMVAAWTPFAIRGFIWYQGCHNAGEPRRYCAKMHALYDGWAKEFQNPGLKLYFVELAPFSASWFNLQLQQEKFAAEEKNAALAVICDHGNLADIHPNDKEIVAKRLALHALKNDYGFTGVRADSPALKSWRVEGDRFILTFDHVKEWYVYEAGRSLAPNFEIAGANGKFVPARLHNVEPNGRVKGVELVVSADGVSEPKRLRHLAKSPYTGILYSDVTLPLGPLDVDARTNRAVRTGAPAKLGDAAKIPELRGYRKALQLDLAAVPNFGARPPADPAPGGPFRRVAYLLELEREDGLVDWVMTAMDAFSDDPAKIGVPYRAGAFIQTRVKALTVRSNLSSVHPVTDAEGGVIEFWSANYSQGAALEGAGGDSSVYDFNDFCDKGGKVGYGSMQVHNAARGETLWALNDFNGLSVSDIGIGPNDDSENSDWTFMKNADAYRARRLTIYVR